MARKRPQEPDVGDSPSGRLSQKRSRQQLQDGADDEPVNGTPSKRRRQAADPYEVPSDSDANEEENEEEAAETEPEEYTPKKRRGRPPKPATPKASGAVTPSKLRQVNTLVTPVKAAITPRRRQAADRSARRKSARALIQSIVADENSDEDDDDSLAREIYESSEEDDDEVEEQGTPRATTATTKSTAASASTAREAAQPSEPETPSATPRRRGRPRKQPPPKSPTPPRDLPPHEIYFEHNKPGRAKTSHNTLVSLELLTHEEYFDLLRARREGEKDPHEEDLAYLQSLHETSFEQWRFELAQSFSLCLYGHGSKRGLTAKLAEHLYAADPNAPIVVVNGYVRSLTARDVFTTVAAALGGNPPVKLPAQTTAMVQALSSALTSSSSHHPITIILNSIDAAPLRKPATQQLLSQLASHPRIRLVATADTPSFPLLWDAAQRTAFNFLFHDATTLQPLEVELDPVDEVHELLGRKARRVNGKDGVVFVLRSLPENAKKLFELLVIEVLAAMDDDGGGQHGAENPGVEYRMVYNKAVEDFICSSEMAFRTLLKEFHDHQIITSRKDTLGTELLSIPFRREELEAILEDLMS
ncbi:origin recognition complex subunit 2 [Colletotrichum orchidophilum]|uniref:Origin recognition complex subunit 2 n=1 Tax=Colletotrichum orchidophilum TaxID=1209926 RepID=A0A1G4BN12_9PEZI|nr:origin recognition complex subunit 2 [Colletotrichum orchidophilum]OHF02849.1 origin recognition complex subunit 2 [Colletotrichum orchidophilum]